MTGIFSHNLQAIAVLMVVVAAIPALFPQLAVPTVILEIMAGVIVGPHVSDILHPHIITNFLAHFGLGLLFLMTGLELEPDKLKGEPINKASIGWIMSLMLSFLLTYWLFRLGILNEVFLTSVALTSTAITVLLPILRDNSQLVPPYGPAFLAVGIVGKLGPLFFLALASGGEHKLEALLTLLFIISAYYAYSFLEKYKHGKLAIIFSKTMHSSSQLPMRIALAALILLVSLSEYLKIDTALGALVAGLLLRALLQDHHNEAIGARLDGIASALLVPIFFIVSGTTLDLVSVFTSLSSLKMVVLYAVLALIIRGFPALVLYRHQLSINQQIALAFHSSAHLPLVVVIASIGLSNGSLNTQTATELVGGAMLTMLLYPVMATKFLNKM